MSKVPMLAETEFWKTKGKDCFCDSNRLDPTKTSSESNNRIRIACEECGKIMTKRVRIWVEKESCLCQACARRHREEEAAQSKGPKVKPSPTLWEAYPWQMILRWDWRLNDKAPWEVPCTSRKNVWLICLECGRSFERAPRHIHRGYQKVRKQCVCPYCSGIILIPGETDLCTTNPDLAKEWHPTKNGDLRPEMVTAHSTKKVWWMDEYGNEAYITVRNRVNSILSLAERSEQHRHATLREERPDLFAQALPEDNPNIDLENLSGASGVIVVWTDEFGHKWPASVKSRTLLNSGCPYCDGKKVLVGFNSLSTLDPDVAAEWHPTLNGLLTPDDVTAQSNQTVWWLCPKCGHPYRNRINNRTRSRGGAGCPICDPSSSALERETAKVLDSLGMTYVAERRFPGCADKMPLRWDFAIYAKVSDTALMLQALLECQGVQHDMPVELYGGEEEFIRRKQHDEKKKSWAEENGILFTEVRYDETKEQRRNKLEHMFSTLEADPAAHCLEGGC